MKKFLLLLVILILPSAFYVFLTAGKEKNFVRLPYYGPKKPIHITENGKSRIDTVFYHIPAFSFYNQQGATITDNSLVDKIWIAYFTSFADTKNAPSLAVLMNHVEERTNLDSAIRLVTFSLDSQSAKSMQDYATMIHAKDSRRIFLSGNKEALNEMATEGFYKPVDSSSAKGFIYFFLIDKEGCIRGIYNGLLVKDIDYLVDDTGMLEAAYYIMNEKKNKDKDRDDAM